MSGEIIEFSTQTTEATAVPVPRSFTPTLLLPLSRMTLCQSDVEIPSADVSNQVDRDQQPQPCSSYAHNLSTSTPKLKFPPRLSSTDELDEAILHDLEIRPLTRTDITSFVNLDNILWCSNHCL